MGRERSGLPEALAEVHGAWPGANSPDHVNFALGRTMARPLHDEDSEPGHDQCD